MIKMTIVKDGYVRRGKGNQRKRTRATQIHSYDWYVVKNCQILLNIVNFPPEFEGKKVKFKVEVIDNNETIKKKHYEKMGKRGICVTCMEKHKCPMPTALMNRDKMLGTDDQFAGKGKGGEAEAMFDEYYIDDPTYDDYGNIDWCPEHNEIPKHIINFSNDKILSRGTSGVKLKCLNCNHEWLYTGKNEIKVRCVSCGRNVDI
jgi:hypothetical protein